MEMPKHWYGLRRSSGDRASSSELYHGGIPEVVLDGKTGLVVPERDSHALAAHILRLLQDEPFWQACSTRAALWMEERFDLVKQTQELEQIYSSLLK